MIHFESWVSCEFSFFLFLVCSSLFTQHKHSQFNAVNIILKHFWHSFCFFRNNKCSLFVFHFVKYCYYHANFGLASPHYLLLSYCTLHQDLGQTFLAKIHHREWTHNFLNFDCQVWISARISTENNKYMSLGGRDE